MDAGAEFLDKGNHLILLPSQYCYLMVLRRIGNK